LPKSKTNLHLTRDTEKSTQLNNKANNSANKINSFNNNINNKNKRNQYMEEVSTEYVRKNSQLMAVWKLISKQSDDNMKLRQRTRELIEEL
jgi:UDP-glucose 6-dehydrogenase